MSAENGVWALLERLCVAKEEKKRGENRIRDIQIGFRPRLPTTNWFSVYSLVLFSAGELFEGSQLQHNSNQAFLYHTIMTIVTERPTWTKTEHPNYLVLSGASNAGTAYTLIERYACESSLLINDPSASSMSMQLTNVQSTADLLSICLG